MEFTDYQTTAHRTVRFSTGDDNDDHLVVPLLGVAGEVGSLLVEYKKFLRDGPAHRLFNDHVAEELGDMLWYISELATQFNLDLNDIATRNLEKTQERWGTDESVADTRRLFDDEYEQDERLPRQFLAQIREEVAADGSPKIILTVDGVATGAKLRDNAWEDDGYRFHDVFHLAHAAVLGWSPVLRAILGRKRRSRPEIDEVEDGGRAVVIDEAIVALVFEYARDHAFLEDVSTVDWELLRTIKRLTNGCECRTRSLREWELAILAGTRAWRHLREHKRGSFRGDLVAGTFEISDGAEAIA